MVKTDLGLNLSSSVYCVMVGKALNFSEPHFLFGGDGASNNTGHLGTHVRIRWGKGSECPVQCWACGKGVEAGLFPCQEALTGFRAGMPAPPK